jgi:uncharacterized repeat protein (TIGR01451 family)
MLTPQNACYPLQQIVNLSFLLPVKIKRSRSIFQRIFALTITLFLILMYLPFIPKAKAFVPTNLKAAILTSPFDQTHQSITEDAIKELDTEFFGVTKLTKSMKKAIETIADENAKVDGDQKTAAKHFDGESFPEGQARLTGLFTNITTSLSISNAQGAREALGQALHTLQDFYSHSNWIESGNLFPNPAVGTPGVFINRLADNVPTCDGCVTCLGCLNNIITTELTSGYYSGEDRAKPNSNKCSHGGPLDFSVLSGGINKDSSLCTRSPHFFLHFIAASVAKEATKHFIRSIKDVVTPRQIKLLLGVGPTLTISMDTTGSMGSIIEGVKQQAIQIVNDRLGTDEEPSKYVLAPFNDPGVGPLTATDDANTFKAAISSLFASGGGDCPELAMMGMLQGLSASDEGGVMFMFTDASAKDSGLAGTVTSVATSKDIEVYPILFGSCSPTDPGFIRVANESGGQVFLLFRSEAGNITRLADFVIRSNAVNVLSIADSLAGTPKAYTVPVDTAMTKVTLSVSGTTSVIAKRPDGSTVTPADTGVSLVSLSSGQVISIANPVAGNWNVMVNGSGDFSISASGDSTLDLTDFRFVEPGGRPDHEGFFPIAGLPEAGSTSTVDAIMSGDFNTAQFDLRSKAGGPLQTLSLTQGAGVSTQEFSGDVTLPNTSFLVYVTGLDLNGNPYQRVLPASVRPQTVKIIAPLSQDLRAGQPTTYTFQVKNLGSTDTFTLSAADDKSFLNNISPTTLTLNGNETKDVTVILRPPTNAQPGLSDTLTVTVRSTTTDANNFAVVTSLLTAVNSADLGVSQTASPNPVTTGSNQAYAISVVNNGPGDAVSVSLTDSLPTGTTFQSMTVPANWSCTTPGAGFPGTVTCTTPTQPAGSTANFTLVVNVSCPDADGARLTNTAAISSTTDDPNAANNLAILTVTTSNPAPIISGASVDQPIIWPPNHKLVGVTVNYSVSDNCGPISSSLSVTSNEPVNGTGDGDTNPDWLIQNAHQVLLRAERAGNGSGRVYSIKITATDSAGGSSSQTVYVNVLKNQR